MALKPLKGKPGKFLDTTTGRTIDISDFIESDKYDTIIIPAGPILAGTIFTFFRDVAAKRPIDTNFSQQSRLSAGEELLIDRIGVALPQATGNLLPPPADTKRVAEDGFIRFEVNRLLLNEGPIVKFPAGYGLAGNDPGLGNLTVGVASTAAAAKLVKTQLVTSAHEVQATLTFFDRDWTLGALAALDRMPTLTTPMFVKAYLHGLIKLAVSK